ncbi:MAG TPA: T9SS type A sorting domain-containing protein [Flavilitoribacter sp.]|nr:T9SS type A sorting domain-containing protein [Flavilitoribacter sp.]HMQ86343.1 T9SS type A sorting domain-containing protein [Flavilitoribacter sp.]
MKIFTPPPHGIAVLIFSLAFLAGTKSWAQVPDSHYCPQEPPVFTGPPETTLCEMYGNLNFTLTVGAGTPFPGTGQWTSFPAQNIFITGDFTIEEDFDITGKTIKIAPGAQIILSSVATLTLDNSKLFACSGLWEGIIMNAFSKVRTRNNTRIEDAETALRSVNEQNTSLELENTIFNRNRVGVLLEIPAFSNDPFTFSPFPPVLLKFKGNTFSCDAPLNGTVDEISFAGLQSRNAPVVANQLALNEQNVFKDLEYGVHVSGDFTSVAVSQGRFNNIRKDGIFLEKGNLRLTNSRFENCHEKGIHIVLAQNVRAESSLISFDTALPESEVIRKGVYIGATGIKADIFLSLGVDGAFDQTDNRLYGLHLRGGRIGAGTKIAVADGGYGVRARNSCGILIDGAFPETSEVDIYNNNFSASLWPFSGSPPEAERPYGIMIRDGAKHNLGIYGSNHFTAYGPFGGGILFSANLGGTGNEISDNDFNGLGGGQNLDICVRIFRTPNLVICSNRIRQETGTAFQFIGADSDMQLVANEINGMETGVDIFPLSVISAQEHNGNKWLPVKKVTPFGLEYVRANPQARCQTFSFTDINKFTVHTPQSIWNEAENKYAYFSEYYPENIVPDGNDGLFEQLPGTPKETCAVQTPAPISELDEKLALGQFPSPPESPAMAYLLERTLYRKLDKNPDLKNSHPGFPGFMTVKENAPVGRLHAVAAKVEEAVAAGPNLQLEAGFIGAEMENLYLALQVTDSLLQTTADPQIFEQYAQDKYALLNDLQALQGEYQALETDYRQQVKSVLVQALQLNEQTQASAVWEVNEKEVNRIFLESTIYQNDTLTAGQLSQLEWIAEEPEETGGAASGMARGMLPGCIKGKGVKEADSAVSLGHHPENAPVEATVNVFPNPARDHFELDLPEGTVGQNLELYDLTGQKVYAFQIAGENERFNLPDRLPAGIYLLKVKRTNGKMTVHKLVVR